MQVDRAHHIEHTGSVMEFDMRTEAMPSDMQLLLDEYPRESWTSHAGFKDKTRQWLGAHQMFRRLSASVRQDAETFLDGDLELQRYVRELSYKGSALVGNLHGHHGWEDHSYFPELLAADARFKKGLDILEQDHADLDPILDTFAETANRLIRVSREDEKQAQTQVAALHSSASAIETLLQRHLSDEEELAVPIILHHRLRG